MRSLKATGVSADYALVAAHRSVPFAALCGLIWGALCFGALSVFDLGAADFKHALGMARDVLAGHDPYAHEPGPYWVPYPLPAAFLAMPLAILPDALAGAVFVGFSVGLLSWAILRRNEDWRLAILFSWPLLYAVLFAQWSPLLAALWFLPALAPLALAKPNIALPFLLTSRPRWARVLAAAAVLGASMALRPDWPWVWLKQTASYTGMRPPLFSLPWGPLILLSLVCWRQRRAWLILTMAVMPQRAFYDQLALLFVAENRRELFWLITLSWTSFGALWLSPNMAEMPGGWQAWVVVSHYLPAVAVLILPKLRQQLNRRRESSEEVPYTNGRGVQPPAVLPSGSKCNHGFKSRGTCTMRSLASRRAPLTSVPIPHSSIVASSTKRR